MDEELDEPLVDFLYLIKGKRIRVTVPKQGEKRKLLDLARKNVEIRFFGDRKKLVALQEALSLSKTPNVIEVFDVSHLAGSFTVGSMVQFRGGRPDKKGYRRFKIRTVEGIDDFASIGEIVKRRYTRQKEEDGEMPDLIVIDGERVSSGPRPKSFGGWGSLYLSYPSPRGRRRSTPSAASGPFPSNGTIRPPSSSRR